MRLSVKHFKQVGCEVMVFLKLNKTPGMQFKEMTINYSLKKIKSQINILNQILPDLDMTAIPE